MKKETHSNNKNFFEWEKTFIWKKKKKKKILMSSLF